MLQISINSRFCFNTLDMHDCPEKEKEVSRLKEVKEKLTKFVGVAGENRKKYKITGV